MIPQSRDRSSFAEATADWLGNRNPNESNLMKDKYAFAGLWDNRRFFM